MPAAPDDPARADAPLTVAEVDALFASLAGRGRLALAVSGGADSTALLHLFNDWRSRADGADVPLPLVLTVDHGLRPESRDEAQAVEALCARLGLPHRILSWTGEKPARGIQHAARSTRLALMRAAMAEAGCAALVLAHHCNDQAETFLDRLARGSGVYGLAAMAPETSRGGVTLLRPLLSVPKARLVATLVARDASWAEDPSNRDPRYRRTAMRALLPTLGEVGIDAARLAATARSMARAAQALESWADSVIATRVEQHPAGPLRLSLAGFDALPEEIRLRVVARLLRRCAQADYTPRLASLEAAVDAVLGSDDAPDRTLAGCVLRRRGEFLILSRETGRAPPSPQRLGPGESLDWDARLRISLAAGAPGAVLVGPLGEGGLRRAGLAPASGWPAAAFETVPAAFACVDAEACEESEAAVWLEGFDLPALREPWAAQVSARPIAATQ